MGTTIVFFFNDESKTFDYRTDLQILPRYSIVVGMYHKESKTLVKVPDTFDVPNGLDDFIQNIVLSLN